MDAKVFIRVRISKYEMDFELKRVKTLRVKNTVLSRYIAAVSKFYRWTSNPISGVADHEITRKTLKNVKNAGPYCTVFCLGLLDILFIQLTFHCRSNLGN